MATTNKNYVVGGVPVSADLVGGLVIAVLGLLHLFVIGIGGFIGVVVLFVGWPLVGGIVAARLSTAERARLAALLSGAIAAFLTALVVLVTGYLGVWSTFLEANFGVSLWAVTFAVLVTFTIAWTVSAFVGGYVTERL